MFDRVGLAGFWISESPAPGRRKKDAVSGRKLRLAFQQSEVRAIRTLNVNAAGHPGSSPCKPPGRAGGPLDACREAPLHLHTIRFFQSKSAPVAAGSAGISSQAHIFDQVWMARFLQFDRHFERIAMRHGAEWATAIPIAERAPTARRRFDVLEKIAFLGVAIDHMDAVCSV